jgi:hypothetical protein
MRDLDGGGGYLLLHHFPRSHQVDRALRVAVRELHGAMDELLNIFARPDFVVVANIAADNPALIAHVLDPLNEFVAAAAHLALLGKWRGSREDKGRNASLGGVVDSATQRLGSTFHVHHHGLRLAAYLRVTMCRTERHHLIGAGDDLRNGPARNMRFGNRFDQSGVVASPIRENI